MDKRETYVIASDRVDGLLDRGIPINRKSYVRGFGEGEHFGYQRAKERIHEMIEHQKKMRLIPRKHIEGLEQAWGLICELPDWLFDEQTKERKTTAQQATVREE